MPERNACAIEFPETATKVLQGSAIVGMPTASGHVPVNGCRQCAYMFFPSVRQDILDNYYETEYAESAKSWYNFSNDHEPGFVNYRSNLVEGTMLRWGLAKNHVLHEIGCAFGGTVLELDRRGYRVSGSELNKKAVAEAIQRGVRGIFAAPAGDVLSKSGTKANFVYAFHALEHFSEPIRFLRSIRLLMAEDSAAMFAVPNALPLDALIHGYHSYDWLSYPGHLWMWSASSVLCLARAAGFKVLDVTSNEVPLRGAEYRKPLDDADLSSIATFVRQNIIRQLYMGEELVFVLTPESSNISNRFSDSIARTEALLVEHRAWETRMKEGFAQFPPHDPVKS